jgi:mannose-6-phosphate isomerase-like protein (cupin superfamily)
MIKSMSLVVNIERATLENEFYRRVIYTDNKTQTVLMSLLPGEDIPLETHTGSQFIRVEAGSGIIMLDDTVYALHDGVAVNILPGTQHYVKNTGTDRLQLYSLYSPPEHSPTRIELTDPQTLSRQIISP